jgi:sec-independent protein translocase protein TatA
MGNFGWTEILLIAFVVLLLFGGKKIPELMRGLGRGVREFNDAKNNVKKEMEESLNEKERQTTSTNSTTTASQP